MNKIEVLKKKIEIAKMELELAELSSSLKRVQPKEPRKPRTTKKATHANNRVFIGKLSSYLQAGACSQRELAEAIDVSPSAISSWLRNKSIPTAENITKVLNFIEGKKSDEE